MEIYKFKLAPTDTHFQIPFDLTEKAFKKWLDSLENSLDSEKSHQIFLAIQAINKEKILANTKKSFLLTIIYKAIPNSLHPLKKAISNSALPLTEEELDSARYVVWIYAELANGFASCITKKSNLSSALTLFYGIQSLITAYIHISEVYQQPYPGFWKLSYKFYGLACRLGIQDLSIEHHSEHSDTINRAFKHLLSLYHCGMEQFRPRDIITISNCVEKRTSMMILDEKYTQKKASQYSALDLNTDLPPSALSRLKKTEKSALRFFSAYSAAATICKNAPNEVVGTGIIRSINLENILQAAKTLSLSQKRKFTRLNEKQIKSGIVGFKNIIDELAESSDLSPATQGENSPAQFDPRVAGGWEAPDLELVSEGYELLDVMKVKLGQEHLFSSDNDQLNQALKVFGANNKNYSHDTSIWESSSASEKEDLNSLASSELDISNSSIKGYKIIYDTDENATRVQIGDIIGIKNNDAMEIGIVRRIIQLTEHKLELGIKLLGLESEIAYISLPKHESVYAWVLFLPKMKAIDTTDSIIFNDCKFQRGEFINLYRTDEEVVCCRLNKLLHLSCAATHIELFNSSIMDDF